MIWIILLGWLYVVLMVAATSSSVIYGVLLFIFVGILPVWLALWFWGIPLRRRIRQQQEQAQTNPESDQPDQ